MTIKNAQRTNSALARLLTDSTAGQTVSRTTPKRSESSRNERAPELIYCAQITTVLGVMIAGATEKGICLLEFWETESGADKLMSGSRPSGRLVQQINRVSQRFDRPMCERRHKYLTHLRRELKAYLRGQLREFTVPLDIRGTVFQQAVWTYLQQLPYGSTISYQQLAEQLDRPLAVRAVGAANGANPLSLLVPCHRVVGSGGALTGYGGGVPRKQWLLDLEAGQKKRFIA